MQGGCVFRAVKAYALFLLALVVLPLSAGYLYAWWWLPRAEGAWAKDFEPMPALVQRYAKAAASPGARRLDVLARPLGIVFLDTAKQSEALKAFAEHVTKHEIATEEGIQPASAVITDFLASHGSEIREIEDLLESGEAVSWPIDIETGYDAPIPPLLAYRQLHAVLLVRALEAARRGRREEAQRSLEASWRVSRSMAGRPEILAQLIAMAITGMQGGVLRCLPERPTAWADRMVEHKFRSSLLTSLQLEAHLFGFFGRGYVGVTDISSTEAGMPRQPGATHAIIRFLSAPYLKLSVAGYEERLRLAALELKQRDPCEVDASALAQASRDALPRWNIIGRIALSSLIEAWGPAVLADLDAERTRLVIRAAGGGGSLATFPSEVCASVTWRVGRDPADRRTLTGEGAHLPARERAPWTFRFRARS